MKPQPTKSLLTLLLFVFYSTLFAQEGIISGVLNDDNGLPIPGATIIIKGTANGITTDFDGQYNISCNLGDTLVFNYIGMKTKEVVVTSKMFNGKLDPFSIKKTPIKTIKSDAYKKALHGIKSSVFTIPSITQSNRTYNKNSYFQYDRIKAIEVKNDNVKLTYFKPDVYYEVGFKTNNSLQFVKKSNLPKLQNRYSQGFSNNGEFTFQGPETGTVFSYGPQLNLLEFDGANYEYDTNGKLVTIGNGNGKSPKTYNNSIFSTSLKSINHLFLNINTIYTSFGFDFNNKTQKDLYAIEQNTSNNYALKFKTKLNSVNNLAWDAFVNYTNTINNQPNINGFQNNLLFNTWVTPTNFSNNQGFKLPNDTQRSFAPNTFNNPNWLLNNNRNVETNTLFVSSLQNKIRVTKAFLINTKLNYSNYINAQNFGVIKNSNGFDNGYLSNRIIDRNNFNAALKLSFTKNNDNSKIDISSTTDFLYEDLKYSLFQAEGFENFNFVNAQNNISNTKNLNRNTLRLLNKITYTLNNDHVIVSLSNSSYNSSIQNNKWVLPTLQMTLNIDDIFDIRDFYKFSISASTAYDVNDAALLYNNQSHNSLNILPEQSLSYNAINDLFINKSIQLEEKRSYDFSLNLAFWALNTQFDFGFTYFANKTKNTVFPIFENNTFKLKNVADVKNKGIEIDLSSQIRLSYNFNYRPIFTISTHRPLVSKLLDNTNRIPIAGFSTVSKNLIAGKPAGIIFGSAYVRDTNNNLIIGDNGFPLVDSDQQIIGNPIPKYNLGFNNEFEWKSFKLNFLIDFQKGGDIWNGTQNVLNYFGTSQQSSTERNISNFIFNGVNQQGTTNTIPVDFYNPNNPISENRFVRYGFEGVAEDAIKDGSYINLKSIDITYTIKQNVKDKLIRSLDIGLYANNLITWTKFKGASPYSSLYDNSSAKGLNFFNAPQISEVGLKINLKL